MECYFNKCWKGRTSETLSSFLFPCRAKSLEDKFWNPRNVGGYFGKILNMGGHFRSYSCIYPSRFSNRTASEESWKWLIGPLLAERERQRGRCCCCWWWSIHPTQHFVACPLRSGKDLLSLCNISFLHEEFSEI